ncbi:alpha/beta fold hydrolase [Actinomadura macrotermitis]|uniref:Tripeptidyl aminopeptidase n=1 Tax=Actinomadura macrotermitis TaxID=2585200 RepID=A0A7K0BWJ6_9ACTN|nr:alpha/beta fold hydrolase [Actinomadura macrotermitis]MQY05553.1 Tripeptidyl aminopeptidase [Actinomadura macrotermitis]
MRPIFTRSLAAASLAAAGAGLTGVADAAPPGPRAAAEASPSRVSWHTCPQYSDAVLDFLRIQPRDRPKFRALWARTQCGTIEVPQDYRRPHKKITIAFTRLPAADRAHRLGSLAMNPGGPGGSGYLLPAHLLLQNATDAKLNDRYDLIGFDPRGTGYSTLVDCPPVGDTGLSPLGARAGKAELRKHYDAVRAQRKKCSTTHSAFLSQLTTANVARDLDRIRQALHEKRMSYFGASWGTQLGAVYRSMFPKTIGRMWLDSVVSPRAHDLSYRFDAVARSTEQDFALFASWLAARNGTYHLGATPAQVRATVLKLRRDADADPWRFSDLPQALGGGFIAFAAAAADTGYDRAGQALKAMTAAARGGPVPQAVKDMLSGGPERPPTPPPGTPRFNATAGDAFLCNEDTSSRDFASFWKEYQAGLKRNPVTGDMTALRPTCAGWSLPVQRFELRRSSGSLQLSGHRHETVTPYPWVYQMQKAIGGNVLTVDDFAHGSLFLVEACAAHLVTYLDTGRPDNGTCPGIRPGTDLRTGSVGSSLPTTTPYSWTDRL